MARLRLKLVDENFSGYTGRVQQGEILVSSGELVTILGSCVCIGVYHSDKGIAGISHVTGFKDEHGHTAAGAIDLLNAALKPYKLDVSMCECFVVGGTDSARHVYDRTIDELQARQMSYVKLDVLGQWHRKVAVSPADGTIKVYRSPLSKKKVGNVFEASDSEERFSDPSKRIATGASIWFRNQELLDSLNNTFLADEEISSGERIHVWCAGCSLGLEAYSIAVVLLTGLAKRNIHADLRVLGSDISEQALATAREGLYSVNWQHLGEYRPLLERYTVRAANGRVRIGDELAKIVAFRKRNIEEGSRKHRFELVVCDHVLQYYPEEKQLKLLNGLTGAVTDGGYLYVSTPLNRVRESVESNYPFQRRGQDLYQRV